MKLSRLSLVYGKECSIVMSCFTGCRPGVTEFFDQGDKERAMFKTTPQALMDRERQDELPRLQMEWIDGICLPLFKVR